MATVRNLKRNINNPMRMNYDEALAMFPPNKTIDSFRARYPKQGKKAGKKTGGTRFKFTGAGDVGKAPIVNRKFGTESFVERGYAELLRGSSDNVTQS